MVPPVAVSVTVPYETPTVPLGNVGAVVMVGPGMIFSEKACVAVPLRLSVTWMLKLNGPETEGVPLRTPAELRVKPLGSEDPLATAQVNPVPEPPEAVRVCE